MESTDCLAKSNRIAWVDNAKAFAMLFIVLGHTLSDESGYAYMYLYSFHILLFFFLAGVTFSAKKKVGEFIIGKIKSIMIPYYIFSLISIVLYKAVGGYTAAVMNRTVSDLSIKDCIIGMLYGNRMNGLMTWNTPLWFLPSLFAMLIFFYLIGRTVLKSDKPLAYVLTMIFLTALMLLNMLVFKIKNLPLGFNIVIDAAPFFMAGICVRRFKIDKLIENNLHIAIRAVIAVILVAGGVYVASLNGYVNVSSSVFKNIGLYFAAAILGIAAWSVISGLFRLRLSSYVGMNTMPILLMHKFPIMFVGTLFPALMSGSNILVCLPLALVFTALCLIAGLIIEKFAPYIIGKSKK